MAKPTRESPTESARRSYVSRYVKYVLAGEAIWGLAVLATVLFDTFESSFPQWFVELDLPHDLGTICGVIAFPIALVGWMFVWGDNGPPYGWLGDLWFNVLFGVFFYAALGVLAGLWASLIYSIYSGAKKVLGPHS